VKLIFSVRIKTEQFERNHLTAETTGKIAKDADVKEVVIIHISPKYIANPQEVYKEVELSRSGVLQQG